MKTYKCKVCGKESKWSHQKVNKYCSTSCTGEARILESIERVKKGLVKDRDTLRNALTRLQGYSCSLCGITNWNKKEITLQVDHINGIASNNKLDNLRLICPNCHSQSDTFSGRNKGNGRASLGIALR